MHATELRVGHSKGVGGEGIFLFKFSGSSVHVYVPCVCHSTGKPGGVLITLSCLSSVVFSLKLSKSCLV